MEIEYSEEQLEIRRKITKTLENIDGYLSRLATLDGKMNAILKDYRSGTLVDYKDIDEIREEVFMINKRLRENVSTSLYLGDKLLVLDASGDDLKNSINYRVNILLADDMLPASVGESITINSITIRNVGISKWNKPKVKLLVEIPNYEDEELSTFSSEEIELPYLSTGDTYSIEDIKLFPNKGEGLTLKGVYSGTLKLVMGEMGSIRTPKPVSIQIV